MVKRSRVQSGELPRRRIWRLMVPPDCSFQAHTRSTKATRPTSFREVPSATSCFSTTFCVAMPAWSVPGIQSASRPCMRRKRISTSCTVLFSPWPMCRTAVTLGGGITITYGSRPPSRTASAEAPK